MNEHMAWHHLFARQYFVAIAQAEKAVEIDPNFLQAHRVLGLAYLYSGDGDRACPEFTTGVRLSHEDPIALAYLARCYALTHKQAQAREIVASLESAATERYISAAEIAAVHAALGDKAVALRWLVRACDERAGALIYLNIDPVFDVMRDDPAFQRIVERVGLPKMAPLVGRTFELWHRMGRPRPEQVFLFVVSRWSRRGGRLAKATPQRRSIVSAGTPGVLDCAGAVSFTVARTEAVART